jgi:iron complex outermembrane receptor protein
VARDWWRLSAGLSTLYKDLGLKPGNRDFTGIAFAGNDPDYQFQLRSSMDITQDLMLDLWLRNVDGLQSPKVSAYIEMDARIAYEIAPELELSLVGQNLLHDRHVEFINPSVPVREIPRSFYIELRSQL